MVNVVSAGLPQLLCVWSATGGPGSPVVFACVFSVSLHGWGWGGWMLASLGLFRLGIL